MRGKPAVIAAAFFSFVATAQARTNSANEQASAQTSAETGNKPGQKAATNASLVAGWPISAELRTSLDSKRAKQGDAIEARMTEAVKANGKTILPSGTKLAGHVTQASAKSKGDADSSLGLVFDKAILKGGEEIPLNVTLQALATPDVAPGASAVDTMGTSSPGTPVNSGVPGGVSSRDMGPGTSAGSPNRPNAGGTPGEAGGTSSDVSGGTLNAAGRLTPNSRGVFGVKGGVLKRETSNGAGSLITSTGKNVRLDGGTQLLLVTRGANVDETSKP
jgi:hypothetical protein